MTGMIRFGLLCVLSELPHETRLSRVNLVTFSPGNLLCKDFDGIVPNLDFHVGVCLEIEVPVRIRVRSSLRGEDQVAVSFLQIRHWVGPCNAGPGPGVVDE